MLTYIDFNCLEVHIHGGTHYLQLVYGSGVEFIRRRSTLREHIALRVGRLTYKNYEWSSAYSDP
jgi:hypothetical protein